MCTLLQSMGAIAKARKLYTYGDYVAWGDDERWELIEGEAYNISPAPRNSHQTILGNLHFQFYGYLKGKKCQVKIAAFDVLLPEKNEANEDVMTVVQPDLLIVCDPKKVHEFGLRGAPDIAIEILSESTMRKDQTVKKKLYEKHGVKEYWIVYPHEKIVQLFRLKGKKYLEPEIYATQDKIPVKLLGRFSVDLKEVFTL
jgi:Uma2 family endonuclease